MSENNRIVPRYDANITMGEPTVAKVLDGDDYVDRQMMKNHARAEAAERSTQVRLELGFEIVGKLATMSVQSVTQLNRLVQKETEGLDRENKQDFVAIDHGEQVTASLSNIYLKMINAAGVYLAQQAGSDIRQNIKPEAPPVEKPQTVIVQQTGPKLRPANLFEGGKTKYVIDE